MIEEFQWEKNLENLIGENPNAKTQAKELLLFRTALGNKRFNVTDKMGILDWVSNIDSAQQVFIIPQLSLLLFDPAKQVRNRVGELLDNLLGNSCISLIADILRLADDAGHPQKIMEQTLQELERLFCEENEIAKDLPFGALLIVRDSIFAFSALQSISIGFKKSKRRDHYMDAFQAFFDDHGNRAKYYRNLKIWAEEGPMFLRYLALQWVGESGYSPISVVSATEYLKKRYCIENDPIVASAAIQAFANTLKDDEGELKKATSYLFKELTTLKNYPIPWRVKSPGKSIKIITIGILNALGHIMIEHLPMWTDSKPCEDQKNDGAYGSCGKTALEYFLRLIKTFPTLDLSLFNQKTEIREKQSILRAALLLYHPENKLRVEIRQQRFKNRLMWTAGFGTSIKVIDRKQLEKKFQNAQGFWAKPIPQKDKDPLNWTFELLTVKAKKSVPTQDLLGLISPVFSAFLNQTPKKHDYKTTNPTQGQIDLRFLWMEVTCNIAVKVINKALSCGILLVHEKIQPIFWYLKCMAEGAHIVTAKYNKPKHKNRCDLKDILTSCFLNELVTFKSCGAIQTNAIFSK